MTFYREMAYSIFMKMRCYYQWTNLWILSDCKWSGIMRHTYTPTCVYKTIRIFYILLYTHSYVKVKRKQYIFPMLLLLLCRLPPSLVYILLLYLNFANSCIYFFHAFIYLGYIVMTQCNSLFKCIWFSNVFVISVH